MNTDLVIYEEFSGIYSRTSLVRTPGDRHKCSPYPEFVLTNIIRIEKALKGTEIVFVLTRFYCS